MNRYEKFCGVLVLVFAAAIVTIGQAAKIPVLSGDDKVAILANERSNSEGRAR